MFALRMIQNLLKVALVVLVIYMLLTYSFDWLMLNAGEAELIEWGIGAGLLALMFMAGLFLLSGMAVILSFVLLLIICCLFPILLPLLLIVAFFSLFSD